MNSAMLSPYGGIYIKSIVKELENQEKSNAKASFLCVDCKGNSWNLEGSLSVKIVDTPHTINETEKLNEGAMNEKK